MRPVALKSPLDQNVVCLRTLFLVCVRVMGTLDRLTRMQRDVWLEFWLVGKRGLV